MTIAKTLISNLVQSYLFVEVSLVLLVVGGALLGYSIYNNNSDKSMILGTDNINLSITPKWGIELSE